MRLLTIIPTAIFAFSVSASQAATPATPYVGHELAAQAHVPLARAEAIALKARPGRIKDRELEHEAGGSGLRWSFDIESKGKIYEVGVDAANGKVLEDQAEGAHPD